MRVPKDFLMLFSSNMPFFISQVQVNQSPIGPISPANSREDNLNSETTSQSNREQSSPPSQADIIFMFLMPALGVRNVLFHQP